MGFRNKSAKSLAVTASAKEYGILQMPVITEKASMVAADRSRVVFRVQKDAGKLDIKAAIERIFGVEVQKVRTTNAWGKVKRVGTREGRRASFKKAYVTLKAGHTIDLVEGV